MALPLILYDVAPLLNPSFETDSPSDTTVPTSWETDADQATEQVGTAGGTAVLNRGSGHGTQSLRIQQAMGATGGFYVRQTIATTWLPPKTKIAVKALVQTDPSVNFDVLIREMDGAVVKATSTLTITGDGTVQQIYLERTLTKPSGTDSIMIEISNVANTDAFNDLFFWVDYFHVGQVVNFTQQPFRSLDVAPELRGVLNVGGSSYEAVELADPLTRVRAPYDRIVVGGQLETDLNAFYGYSRNYRRFAFWLDRNDSTNEGKHFSECVLLRGMRESHPSGAARFVSDLDFIAPKEWVSQEVT